MVGRVVKVLWWGDGREGWRHTSWGESDNDNTADPAIIYQLIIRNCLPTEYWDIEYLRSNRLKTNVNIGSSQRAFLYESTVGILANYCKLPQAGSENPITTFQKQTIDLYSSISSPIYCVVISVHLHWTFTLILSGKWLTGWRTTRAWSWHLWKTEMFDVWQSQHFLRIKSKESCFDWGNYNKSIMTDVIQSIISLSQIQRQEEEGEEVQDEAIKSDIKSGDAVRWPTKHSQLIDEDDQTICVLCYQPSLLMISHISYFTSLDLANLLMHFIKPIVFKVIFIIQL